MKRAAFAFAALVAMGACAHAGGSRLIATERAAPPKPLCEDFVKFKAGLAKAASGEVKYTPLTAGQLHFVMGVYAASPITPPGMPPGDGAQLIQFKDYAGIIWTRGKTACESLIATGHKDDQGQPQVSYMPLPVTPDLLKMLEAVKTGSGEVLSSDDSEGDLKL